MSSGDEKLYALALSNGTAGYASLPRISRGLIDEKRSVADAFARDKDELIVHAVKNVPETVTFLDDQVRGRHVQVVEKKLGGRVVEHSTNGANGETVGDRPADGISAAAGIGAAQCLQPQLAR